MFDFAHLPPHWTAEEEECVSEREEAVGKMEVGKVFYFVSMCCLWQTRKEVTSFFLISNALYVFAFYTLMIHQVMSFVSSYKLLLIILQHGWTSSWCTKHFPSRPTYLWGENIMQRFHVHFMNINLDFKFPFLSFRLIFISKLFVSVLLNFCDSYPTLTLTLPLTPTIHPSIHFLFGARSQGQLSEHEDPDFPFPGHFLQFGEDWKAFPGQPSDIVTPVYPGSSFRPGGIRYRCLSHLSWLLSMWRSSGSTPSSSRVTELLTLSIREHPATLRRKLTSAACIQVLILSATTQMFMTIGEGRNVDWPVNQELCLSAQVSLHHDRLIHWLHYCRHCTDLPVNLTLHAALTREQNPKILELPHSRQELSPNQEGASQLFPVENHGLRLGGADSHPSRFTLGCKPPQDMLEVLARRSQQDNMVYEKQRWNPWLINDT